MSLPRYAYCLWSGPIAAGQLQQYLEDQFSFYKALCKECKENLDIKFHSSDDGNNIIKQYKKKFKDINILDNSKTLLKLSHDYKLFIGTYNGTNILEMIYINIPIVIYWNKNNWELNNESEYYFGLLYKAKILHYSPESAASFINENYNNIQDWWNMSATMEAITLFKSYYAHVPIRPIKKLSSLLSKY